MYYFSKYELLEDGGALSVRLYLDQGRHEFSSDFFGRVHSGEKDGAAGSLDAAVRRYVKEKLPGVKLRTAYILFGALLIAAIPLTDVDFRPAPAPVPTASVSVPPAAASPAQPDTDTKQPVVTDTAGAETSAGILVLVNKAHPLPAGFIPRDLAVPDVSFKTSSNEVRQLRRDAATALEQMFASAEKSGVKLYAVSGYRSYDKQEAVFASSAKSHGSEEAANQFSARPGQSEHQTGLAMDITGQTSGSGLSQGFGSTTEGKWVRDNAAQFGFIIRYPKGKEAETGYQYEPWHLRYVGKKAAQEITDKGITLEEYLGAADTR